MFTKKPTEAVILLFEVRNFMCSVQKNMKRPPAVGQVNL